MVKTERLILKPISESDEKVIYDLFTDSIVKKTYILPDFESYEQYSKYFQKLLNISNSSERYFWGIYLENSGELMGIINDTGLEKYEVAELGYALLPKYHNKGYATEALGGMIKYLKELGYKKIKTGAFEVNGASMRVMEKCKMTRNGETETYTYRGTEHNVIYYII